MLDMLCKMFTTGESKSMPYHKSSKDTGLLEATAADNFILESVLIYGTENPDVFKHYKLDDLELSVKAPAL